MSTTEASEVTGTLVFFGDSLSDPGNLADQAAEVLPEEVVEEIGDDGRASNGPVWTEVVDDLLGAESVNYAVAGAEAIGSQSIGDFIDEAGLSGDLTVPPGDPALDWDMNLGAQVDRFEADVAGEDVSTATAVILIGGNDYGAIDLTANPLIVLAQAAATLTGIVQSTMVAVADLAALGVGDIVVSSLPSFTFFPAFAGLDAATQDLANQLSDLHNDTLFDAIAEAAGDGLPVRYLELRGITDAILDDQSSFGLIAPYTLTLEDGAPGDLAAFDEDQVAFWDSLHPTEATHKLIAAYTAYALENDAILGTDNIDNGILTGGDDLAFGYGGDDVASGGDGRDIIFGGSGADELSGDNGADILSGGSQADVVPGLWGNDIVSGGAGDDVIRGGVGADVLIDGVGSDTAVGGLGDDTFIWIEESLIGGDGGSNDLLRGHNGEDTLYIVLGADSYAAHATALEGGNPSGALDDLGITAFGIEEIVVLDGRAALDTLSAEDWYADADLWGLI